MKIRLVVAAACVAALAACNADKGGANASNASTSGNTAAPTQTSNGNSGRTVDPTLAQEITLAVNMLKPQLPLRQGPVTIVDLEANGTEMIHTMQVPQDFTEESFQIFRDQLPRQACTNPQMRRMVERGGTNTYRIRDSGGEEFTATINSCS